MKTQVIALHGGETFDTYEEYLEYLRIRKLDFARLMQEDWKSGLQEKLGDDFQVILPQMPNKKNAKYLEWKIWFDKIVPFLEDGCILIGHSLGGIFFAKYLSEEIVPKKIKALFLIAAPYDDSDFEDSLADFILPVHLNKLIAQVQTICIYHSEDDPVVPIADIHKYQKAIPKAEVCILKDRQHFNQELFPEIVERIKAIVTNK